MAGDRREIAVSGKLWFIVGLYASEHFQKRTKELDFIYETKNRYQWLTRHGDKMVSDVNNAIRYEIVSFDVVYLTTLSPSNACNVGWDGD
jgi:hypothetical protein